MTTVKMGPRHLRHLGIKPRTLQLYRSEVLQFFEHLKLHRLSLPTDFQELDRLLAEYINHLFQEGESISRAGWLLSGFKRLYPRVRRELCIASQWYMNWTRSHTPERATPITWRILRADVALCFQQNWFHLGTVLLLGFTFMLRTNEFLLLRKSDISFQGVSTIMVRLAAWLRPRQLNNLSNPWFTTMKKLHQSSEKVLVRSKPKCCGPTPLPIFESAFTHCTGSLGWRNSN